MSKRGLAFVFLLVLASGAQATGFDGARSASVLGGALQVGVPPGYCIDQKASRGGKDAAVVLMGRCTDLVKAKPALITVSIGKAGSGGVMTAGGQALAEFFTSAQGRSLLSRDNRAADVRVIQAVGVDDAFLLHLDDRAVGEYWRAVIAVNGRLVTISATGTDAVPLDGAESRVVIDACLKAMHKANPGGK